MIIATMNSGDLILMNLETGDQKMTVIQEMFSTVAEQVTTATEDMVHADLRIMITEIQKRITAGG